MQIKLVTDIMKAGGTSPRCLSTVVYANQQFSKTVYMKTVVQANAKG